MSSVLIGRWRALLATASLLAAVMAGAAFTSPGAAAQASTSTSQPPACPVAGSSVQPLYRDTRYSFAERAADLVSCMTLAEKVAQLRTNSAGDSAAGGAAVHVLERGPARDQQARREHQPWQ